MHTPIQFRTAKIVFCAALLAALALLFSSTIAFAMRERDLIAQLVPAAVLFGIWRVAGWLWFYIARQHALWSFEYLGFRLRSTSSDRQH